MKVSTFNRDKYVEQWGMPGQRSSSEEVLGLWRRVAALPLNEFLILAPDKGESAHALRNRWYIRLKKLTAVAKYNVKFAVHKGNNEVVIWKEARP